MKDWQHGYELDVLKDVEKSYAVYNSWTENPFKQYKKHNIAKDYHDKCLTHFGDRSGHATVKHTYVKTSSLINCYQDISIGRKQKGELVLENITGDLDKLIPFLDSKRNINVWVFSWREDHTLHGYLGEHGFKQHYAKIDTFGSIMGVYYRPGQDFFGDSVMFNFELSKAEQIGIAKLNEEWITDVDSILERVNKYAFQNHYSNYNRMGAWSACSLRGYQDCSLSIEKPAEMNKKWKALNPTWETWGLRDINLRQEFPDVDRLIDAYFPLHEIHRIRFMKLEPGGGELFRHTDQVDPDVGAQVGKLGRFHFPISTNPDVKFSSWDFNGVEQVRNMKVGECWYLDTRKPHRVINGGKTDRIHLVVDVVLKKEDVEAIGNASQEN